MTPASYAAEIQKINQRLVSARHAVVLTGAGISTPSGIPDFRSQRTGLWIQNDPMQVASLTAFQRRPEAFFNWLRPLAVKIWQAQPNPAHIALAELEKAGVVKAIITQNIDGLHQKAGSQQVIEVHGSLRTLSCGACHKVYPSGQFMEPFIDHGQIPHCTFCQKILKPDIVLYEEVLPAEVWSRAYTNSERADVMLVVGSSLEVMPVGGLPWQALESGAEVIIINLSPTPIDQQASVVIHADAAQILPHIAENHCSRLLR
jgi:NAD-dependent deacetylase